MGHYEVRRNQTKSKAHCCCLVVQLCPDYVSLKHSDVFISGS